MRNRANHHTLVWMMAERSKPPHKSLTIDQKIQILDQIGRKSYKVLKDEYGVGISTISDIKKKGQELRDYKKEITEMECKSPANTMKLGAD